MTEATNEAPAAPETATLLTDPPAAESQPDAGQRRRARAVGFMAVGSGV